MGPEPVTRERQVWECWPVLTDHKQTGGYLFSNCSGNTNLDDPCLDTLRYQVSLGTPA